MGAAAALSRSRSLKLLQLLGVLIVCWCPSAAFGQLSVTSRPDALFQGMRNVVPGTVIQLYCEANSAAATFSWTKNGNPVVIDVPHLRNRTTNDSSSTATSVLTIDNFQSSDDGVYQCTAMNNGIMASGSNATLTALTSSSNPILNIDSSITDPDNRTGIALMGNTGNLLKCTAKYSSGASTPPAPQWLKDGVVVVEDMGHISFSMGGTILEIMNFVASDAGVYQCIFTDTDADAEILTTVPFRIDTDLFDDLNQNTIFLEGVSPEIIFLRPPEKLVIEVMISGRYGDIRWSLNGAPQTITPAEYSNYNEIYVRGTTQETDIGLYEVSVISDPFTQRVSPSELDFNVIAPVDANTTSSNGTMVTVLEGESVIISCISVGAPVPSLTWFFDGEVAPFTPMEIINSEAVTLVRSDPNDQNSPLVPDSTSLSNIVSSLRIVNAQYPANDGIYTCSGTNDGQGKNISNATIAVQVIVRPEVVVTADRTRVGLGGTLTLSCAVTRTNPEIDGNYVWTSPNGTVTSGSSNTLEVTFSTIQDFGTYFCNVTNTAGAAGIGNLTIEQAFAPMVMTVQPSLPVVVNTDFELVCVVTGADAPDVMTWTFSGTGAIIFIGNATTGGNFTITISEMSDMDYGTYVCNASNAYGSSQSNITIVRAVGPTITPETMAVEVEVGMPLMLTVSITDFNLEISESDISWTRNGVVLMDQVNGYSIVSTSLNTPPGMSMLTLAAVETPVMHSGTYIVNATNPAGSDTSTFTVTVTAPPNITSPEEATVVTATEGEDVVFTCTATGFPAPTIMWYRGVMESDRIALNGTMGPTTMIDGFSVVTSMLTISSVDRSYSDLYSCVAENTFGPSRSDMGIFNLTVYFNVTILVSPMNVSVLAPGDAELRCQADGRPVPEIVWIRNLDDQFTQTADNVDVTEAIDGLNKTSTLTIQRTTPEDTATYSCRAQNLVSSETSTEVQVNIFVAPNITAPSDGDIFAVNVTNDSTVTCTAFALPPPTIEFFYNGMILNRTDDETGIGVEIPMQVQVGQTSNPVLTDNGSYEVSRNLTLFNVRDERLTGFECRAMNDIVELSMMPSDTAVFEFLVQVPATITTSPTDTTVVSPNNASLTCTAEGVLAPDIVWLREFNGMLMILPVMNPNVTEFEIVQRKTGRITTSTVNFFFTQPEFVAEYTCRASNLLGTVEEVATLTVHVIPVILEPVESTVITVDQFTSAIFDCSAAGIPPPDISWARVYDNGTIVQLTTASDPRVTLLAAEMDSGYDLENVGIVSLVNRTLNLSSALDDDSGTYQCIASNEAGNDTQDFELVVQVPPMVLDFPMNTTVSEGEDATFTCRVSGRPRPSIEWFYLESLSDIMTMTMPQPLNETNGNYGIDQTELGDRELESALTVVMTLPSDTGFYVCFAQNAVAGGIAMASASLSVKVPPMIQAVYPEPDQMSYTVNETETVTFECSATGIPGPSISWSRSGVELSGPRVTINDPVTTNFSRMDDGENVQLVSRTLQLTNTVDDDSGTYTCNATNSAGDDYQSFELIVQIAPAISDLSPLEQTVTSPSAAIFNCSAAGRPRPSISWYRVEVDDSRTFLPDDQSDEMMLGEREIMSTLTVDPTSAADAADYVCVASNIVDDDEMIANLSVYVVPNITSAAPEGGVYVVNETFPVTFMCTATGIPAPDIQWIRESMTLDPANNSLLAQRIELSSPVVDEPERSVAFVMRTLTINDTMEGDAGDYSCVATNVAEGGRDEEAFGLFVQVPPEISPLNGTELTGEEDEMVILTFNITRAIPNVMVGDIRWIYSPDFSETPSGTGNVDITNFTNRTEKSTYTFTPNLLSLTIRDIAQARQEGEPTDRGRYFFVATNPAGSGFSYIDLLVAGPPVISTPPVNQTVINNGSSAVFMCGALAIPPHDVYWTFTNASGYTFPIINTQDGMNTTEYQINNNVNGTNFGTLTVSDVRYADRGVYTCNATNDIGSDLANATLTVHVSPMIERVSNATEVIIGNSTYLVCLATGFPIPTISWLKDNTAVNLYSDVSLNMRIDIFEFDASNESDVSSGYMGSGSIEEFLSGTTVSRSDIMDLGELGVVSFLRFYDVVRGDTAMYSCVAVNELPETTQLRNESNPVQLTVLEPPDPPVNVQILSFGARWVYIGWTITFDGNRDVSSARISIYSTEMMPERELMSGDTTYNVTNLSPFTNYSFGVVACNEIGCGLQSNLSQMVMTLNDTSTAPRELMVEDASQTSLTVSWRAPEFPNGVISQYMFMAVGTKSYNLSFSETKNFMAPENVRMTELTGLTPGTMYEITAYAVNGAGMGERVTTSGDTLNAAPMRPPVDEAPSVGTAPIDNVRTLAITFTEFISTNGEISHYQVGVVLLPEGTSVQNLQHPDDQFPDLNGNAYDPSTCDRASPSVATAYVTAEFASNLFPADGVFVVGSASSPNDRATVYTNGELCYSKRYAFFLRAYPVANPTNQRRSVRQTNSDTSRQYTLFSSTSYTSDFGIPDAPAGPGAIIAGVVVGVLLVAAIIVVIIIIIIVVVRRHSVKIYSPQGFGTDMYEFSNDGYKLTDYHHMEDGSAPHQPIPVASLADHVERNHLNENCGFSEEYKIIQERSAKHTVDACTAPDNKPRNRYANIQCYDHSRVRLTPIEGYEHDYINGNFIDGFNREREYIATQGPLPDTVGDFWRLIWDYNIPSVVMLTNLMEKMKVKCSQYWPNSGSQQYANVNVTLINTIQQADFTIRHFQVKSVNSEEVREVRQFHFTSWPDFGVPRHPTPLLYFLRRIRNSHPYRNERPLLVHCSAGVGRTGSLITIDVELQRARQKQVVDSFNYVLQMRDKRNHMVQTEGQYVFLHDAILEGYTSGDTEIVVGKLAKRMTELEALDDEGISGFRKEFERLREFKVNVREFTDANDDANKFKNRIANALPYNYNRVHLKMSPGIGGSDYINASFIDGYAHKMTYIATQGPLTNTVEDFWRLIWEKESGVIVMLTQLEEKGKEQCSQYWPESKNSPEKMGSQLSVELLSEGEFEDYICRELKITDLTSTDNKHRVVKQFHFTAWPESGAPSTGAGMIDLIDQVIRTQQHTGNKPIVVHCSAGIGRTGAFCALSTAIERVKAEGIVDVFHTVKHLRTQRPHMVQTVDQYAFCYYAIKEYLESLSNYSNFDY